MKFFIPALLLSIYFEFLGQYILRKLKIRKIKVGFGIGLLFCLAFTYIFSSLATSLNGHFIFLLIVYSLFFIISIIIIIIDIRKTKYYFGIFHLIIICLVAIFIYFSYNTTLGPVHGFDTTYYLNLVTSNTNLGHLNNKSLAWGTKGTVSNLYTSQTFYYLASYIVFILKNMFNLAQNIAYIWTFQILFYFLYFCLIINAYEVLDKQRVCTLILSVLFIGFFFGKLYFNSAYGFFGNNYRFVIFGYISLFLYLYFDDCCLKNKLFVSMATLAAASVSSSSLFMIVIEMLVIFIINVNKDKNLIKWIVLTLYLPLVNLAYILTDTYLLSFLLVTFGCALLMLLNKRLQIIIAKYKLNIWIFIMLTLFMLIMSYVTTGNIMDFTIFFNNTSELKDMTINYFNFTNAGIIRILYVLIYLLCLIVVLINNKKDYIGLVIIIMFTIFLNPICCNYFYNVDFVYHRSYDIIINPFIYIYLLNVCLNIINNKKIDVIITSIIGVIFIVYGSLFKPNYYREEFIPNKNYDKIYKMDKYKLDIIQRLKENINNNNIEKPKIITHDILTQSSIPEGEYLYGRYYRINEKWDLPYFQLYAIFFKDYEDNGYQQPKWADTKNVKKYIEEAGVNYLVLDKDDCYYDEETGKWIPLMYLIDKFKYPFYENDKFVIYHFEK